MLKEIMEEPEALRRAILPRIKDGEVVFDGLQLDISRYDSIKIIACGSSYHVGMVGKYNLEKARAHPGRGRAGLRVPLLRPDHRQPHARRRHQPVRRDARHHGRPA